MKKNILITGGTVFVSRFTASYFVEKGYEVYVLNRNTKPQVDGIHLICADRNNLTDELKGYVFDAVIDICAYDRFDIEHLLNALDIVKDYVFISSSAVYPQTNDQPFQETQNTGPNVIWGAYGTNKLEAETYLLSKVPHAYILRPPYLYGPMQNLYREPFVFDCALQHRAFYLPKDGKMKLQFFHVEDLCRFIEIILKRHPEDHIYNVGNKEPVTINTFVELCYQVANIPLKKIYVTNHDQQRDYFSFYDYEYILDVTKQSQLMPDTKNLSLGLKESFDWYVSHQEDVIKKNYLTFIDDYLSKKE